MCTFYVRNSRTFIEQLTFMVFTSHMSELKCHPIQLLFKYSTQPKQSVPASFLNMMEIGHMLNFKT